MRRIFTGKPPSKTGGANAALGRSLAIKRSQPRGYSRGGQHGVKASLTTALAGANNDLVYTAREYGTPGNSIRIRYVVSGNNTAFAVSVAAGTKDITVTAATDGGGLVTTTATAVKNGIAALAAADSLVSVANSGADTGAGLIVALAFTNLAGGTG